MTSQLLIIGNGFDLQCGLKSSYKAFFYHEILDCESEKFGFYNTRCGVFGFWEQLLVEHYSMKGNADNNWCDIENIIKETLLLIFANNKNISKKAYNSIGIKALTRARLNDTPDFSDVKNQIEKFISNYCFYYFRNLSFRDKARTDQDQLHLLIEHLLQELHNLERRFCKYIKNLLNDEYVVNAVNLLARLTEFSIRKYKRIDEFIDERKQIINDGKEVRYDKGLVKSFDNLKSTFVLSFNYTALFDLLNVKSPCRYSNVHGKICNEMCSLNCELSNIIFGIDDTLIQSQSEFNEMRIFSKTYRKMLETSSPESILPSAEIYPVEIKFYGHSLSEADYSYFQSIFDYYNLYSNNKVSLIFYYSVGYNPTDAVYRLINSYGKSLTNQDQGKNLMHKLLLENRLKIVRI